MQAGKSARLQGLHIAASCCIVVGMTEIIRVSMPLAQWLLTMVGALVLGGLLGFKLRK